jgi:hypothetical protein
MLRKEQRGSCSLEAQVQHYQKSPNADTLNNKESLKRKTTGGKMYLKSEKVKRKKKWGRLWK